MLDANFITQLVVGAIIVASTLSISLLVRFTLLFLLNFISKRWSGIISTIISILVIILGAYTLTVYTDISIKAFYAFVGLLVAGVTLGITDFSSKIFNSLRLLSNNYYEIGDYIRIKDYEGKVIKISVQNTVLLSRNNDRIIIPNSVMLEETIINRNSDRNFIICVDLPLQPKDIYETEKDIKYFVEDLIISCMSLKSIGFIRLDEIHPDAYIWKIGVWSENSWEEENAKDRLLKTLIAKLQGIGYTVGYKQTVTIES